MTILKVASAAGTALVCLPAAAQGEAVQIFSGATTNLRAIVPGACTLLQVVLALVAVFYSVMNAKKAMGGDHDSQNAIAKTLAYSAAGFILLSIFKGIALAA